MYLVPTPSDAKKTLAGHAPLEMLHLFKNFLEAEAGNKLCAQLSNRKTKDRSWACCPGKVHGPDIKASHSKNSGKRAYHPSREMQSL